jgi:beta-galactosidase
MPLIKNFARILHGGDYNPDQWLRQPEILEEDFRLMKVSGCNTFSVGIFAWSRLEPEEGSFDFDWLDRLMDRMAQEGNNVLLATPSGARPLWMAQKYEEVRRVERSGQRQIPQGRHNHCWTSPVYRQKVREINSALAGRYGKHPALKMWHVSNEYGGDCFCPLCLESFRGWLRKKYGDLKVLNNAYWSDFWAHRITDWNQLDPRDGALDAMTLDWARFVSWQVKDFFRWEAAPLRDCSPDIPVLTNLMGFYDGVNYHSLARELDLVAEDSYPAYVETDPALAQRAATVGMKFDMLRCLKGQPRPWFLMESCIDGRQIWASIKLKAPGLHHLEMFQALAHGAEGIMYFQWRKGRGGLEKFHGAVVGHVHAEETRSFQEVRTLGSRLDKVGEIIGSLNRAEVALLLDWESRRAYQTSVGLPEREDSQALVTHAAEQYRPFWQRGVTVDVLSSEDDFSSYKVVLIPRLYLLPSGLAVRLRHFVEAGGIVVMTALTGMVDEANLCWMDGCPGDGLENLAGVWMEEVDVLAPNESQRVSAAEDNALGLSGSWPTGTVCTRLHLRGATPIFRYAEGWMADTPAVTRQKVGSGQVYFLGTDLAEEAAAEFYGAIIRAQGLRGFLPGHLPLPQGVSVQCRVKDGCEYWFLMNFSRLPRQIPLPEPAFDVEQEETFRDLVILSPWQVRIFRISAAASSEA